MGKQYDQADEKTNKLVREVIRRWHKGANIEKAGLAVVFVSDGEAHALTYAGYPAKAMVRKITGAARAVCKKAVVMVICHHCWREMPEAQRVALVDHELTHIEVDEHRDGWKVNFRLHDFYVGGFGDVVARHGRDAHEVMSLIDQVKSLGQMMLPGFEVLDTKTGEILGPETASVIDLSGGRLEGQPRVAAEALMARMDDGSESGERAPTSD